MKITVKEKMKLTFDITANADTIRIFIDFQWTLGEACNVGCQTGLTPIRRMVLCFAVWQ